MHANYNNLRDGLCKPKHVGATLITLNDFNCLRVL